MLTQVSLFWFDLLGDVLPNHLITADFDKMPANVQKYRDQLEGRSILVKKMRVLPVEAIVRGYITGSGWAEYKRKGTICDIQLPEGLVESQKLPSVLFTPSTKAEIGDHGKMMICILRKETNHDIDENIHPSKMAEILGDAELAAKVTNAAINLYTKASEFAAEKGIIIADTKFEFGLDENNNLVLVDEVLTPGKCICYRWRMNYGIYWKGNDNVGHMLMLNRDLLDSSRFWPANKYQPGRGQESFDKQIVRNYLESINFDKKTSIELPSEVTDKTMDKYKEVYSLLTGKQITL